MIRSDSHASCSCTPKSLSLLLDVMFHHFLGRLLVDKTRMRRCGKATILILLGRWKGENIAGFGCLGPSTKGVQVADALRHRHVCNKKDEAALWVNSHEPTVLFFVRSTRTGWWNSKTLCRDFS